jgi:hypothetical protein
MFGVNGNRRVRPWLAVRVTRPRWLTVASAVAAMLAAAAPARADVDIEVQNARLCIQNAAGTTP